MPLPRSAGSILCLDKRFGDWFGYNSNELVGKPFTAVCFDKELASNLIDEAARSSEADLMAGKVQPRGQPSKHAYPLYFST